MDSSASDERVIGEAWQHLQESCEKICRTQEERDQIHRAYFLAKEAHHGVRRRSGEPYMLHPIAVAQIVIDEVGLGAKSVVASLLHDVVEDTDYTVEDIEHIFGAKIASMVDGLTKMSGVFNAEISEQAEYFRKVLLTLSEDVRVILIKIADRLHNMRTLGSMPVNKQIKITSETIYLFAPLAYRLGLFAIKSELEDLSMMYRYPKEYQMIESKLKASNAAREEFIKEFNAPIIKMLDQCGIKYEIAGRVKSIYSIWAKMQRKQVTFEEIYDLFAVRIIFQSLPFPTEKTQCWQIYGLITDIYKPNTDRLRDWVSIPKDNGYEALHATVMGPGGVWVEVQLRTQRMDEIAELGFAAHWKYKQQSITSQNDDEFDKWLKKIRDALNSPTDSAVDFLDNFKLALYSSEIVIFTPKGESRKLPQGATALDFAYDIHSNIGNHAIGAKINHKIQPITTKLNSGDQIEIITAETARPRSEWLDVVITPKAVQSIKALFKSEQQNNLERGMVIFEHAMRKLQIPVNRQVMSKVLPAYKSKTKDEFYSNVGAGIISLANLEDVLRTNSQEKMIKLWSLIINRGGKKDKSREEDGASQVDVAPVRSVGDVDDEFVFAECCQPIPGDAVVGFRNYVDNTIVVHKSTCSELHRLAAQFGKHIVKDEIKWSHIKSLSYLSTIAIRGVDRMGLLLDLSKVITCDFNINIRQMNLHSHDGIMEGNISLYVVDSESLDGVMENIRKIKGVDSVKRVDQVKQG
ncbi:MAG: RelA/SpoT family protein [Rikenellaceae bacterium]